MVFAKEADSLLGLGIGFDLVSDNKRDFGHLVNDMSTSLNQSWHSRGGNSRADGVTSLGNVNLSMPAAPNLENSSCSF